MLETDPIKPCKYFNLFCKYRLFFNFACKRGLTGVDEELVGHSWVVHVMNGCGKNGCQYLQISEDGLCLERRKENKEMSFTVNKLAKHGEVLDNGLRPVLPCVTISGMQFGGMPVLVTVMSGTLLSHK